jgi:signal peptide peptidase SppA
MAYDAILRNLDGSIWPILPSKMDAILAFLHARRDGLLVDAETVERLSISNRNNAASSIQRSVAVLPIYGTIAQRAGMMDEASGGTSTERIGREFDALLRDEAVGGIILDVDSPGGNYAGTPELADKIFAARGNGKPIWAVANSMAASAAYWIASAAEKLSITPSGEVGSIGVLAVHYDFSAANEMQGLKPTYVTYGAYKAEFTPDAALSDEAQAELQRRVNEAGETFIKAVARNRNEQERIVRSEYGQGRMFSAREAVARGMADRVETLQEAVERMATGRAAASRRKAEIARQQLELERYR